MLGHSPSNVTHEYILSSYHHVSLHLLIKLLRHASSFTILYKYRIKFLKNPRNWKLDGQGGGRHGARGPRWRHNLIWPRSSLRISRKQAERERERGRDLCSVTWPHAHARARVSVRPILSFPSFCLSLAPLPLSLSLSLFPALSFSGAPYHSSTRVISIAVRCRYLHNLMDSISGAGWRRPRAWNGFYFLPSRCVGPISSGRPLSLCRFIVSWPIRDNCWGNGSRSGAWTKDPSFSNCVFHSSADPNALRRPFLAHARASYGSWICAQLCFITCEIFPPPVMRHG